MELVQPNCTQTTRPSPNQTVPPKDKETEPNTWRRSTFVVERGRLARVHGALTLFFSFPSPFCSFPNSHIEKTQETGEIIDSFMYELSFRTCMLCYDVLNGHMIYS